MNQNPAKMIGNTPISALVVLVCWALILLAGTTILHAHTGEEESLQILNLEIRKDPTNPNLYLDRARIHRLLRNWAAATKDLDRAERLLPSRQAMVLERGLLHFDSEDYSEAIHFFSLYLEELGERDRNATARSRGHHLKARAHALLGQRAAALADLALSVELDPLSGPDIYLETALAALEACPASDCYGDALQWLDLGIDYLGPLVSLQKTAIKLEAQLDRWDRALTRLDSSYAQSDRQDERLELRGDVLMAAGLDSEAESAWEEAFSTLCSLPPRSRQTPYTQRRESRLVFLLGSSQPGCAPSLTPATNSPPAKLPSPLKSRSFGSSYRRRGQNVVRGPYLQLGTPTTAVIRWRTTDSSSGSVHYGADPDSLDRVAFDASLRVDHQVTITGLSPTTQYFYSLAGGSTTPDGSFRTPPLPGAPVDTRIWVIGDSGTANSDAAAVRDAFLQEASSHPPDLWLMLGDNAYPHGTDHQYQEAVFAMYPSLLQSTWLWPVLGNHDVRSADSSHQSGVYFDIFTLPKNGEAGGMATGTEAYYSWDWGPIHFIALNSADASLHPDGAMMQWLEADANATAREWIIAYWHHPPYSKGSHDSDSSEDSGGRLRAMRETFLPVLESAGVDLVLTGHSHSYERSYLLHRHYGLSHTLSNSMVIDGGNGNPQGDGAYANWSLQPGTVYAVAGSSGKTSGGALNHPAMAVSLNRLGSLILDVEGPNLKVRFLNELGIVEDRFTIHHPEPTP